MTFLKAQKNYSVMLTGKYWIALKVFLTLSFAQSLFFRQKTHTMLYYSIGKFIHLGYYYTC